MPPDPGSPEDWLRHARSDYVLAQTPAGGDILLETLCFHAQQAVEKSLKAVLVSKGIPPPVTHNLKSLVERLPPSLTLPADVTDAVDLTDYAVTARYPGSYEEISLEEYQRAIRLAKSVTRWAESIISGE